MARMTEKVFSAGFEGELGSLWPRALEIFRNYGPALSWDVAEVLESAANHGKLEDVLGALEQHWHVELKEQNPGERGGIRNAAGVNRTEVFLEEVREAIRNEALGLPIE